MKILPWAGLAASVALIASACSLTANGVDVERSAGPESNLPACTDEQMSDTLQWITDYTPNRPDLQNIPIAYQAGKTLVQDPAAMAAIAQSTFLPCDPKISLDSLSEAPPNVQVVDSVVGLDRWSTLIQGSQVGTAAGNGPPPVGFEDARATYTMFLNLVARLPYLCGEQGIWPTIKDACQREMASIFANGAQETGAHAGPIELQFTQGMNYTREMGCYAAQCSNYDGGKEAWNAPASAHFYGRGWHQLSYAYNYGSYGSIINNGNYQPFIDDPDIVATDPETLLGSALWFSMSPQPPKPSSHQVIVGSYAPTQDFDGLQLAPDGSVLNKFEAINSIINGGVECRGDATVANAVAGSQNRFRFYKQNLELFGANLTDYEQSIQPGVTWCSNILNKDNGDPWVNPIAIYNPVFYLDSGGSCEAISWQPAAPLPAGAPGMYQVCLNNFGS